MIILTRTTLLESQVSCLYVRCLVSFIEWSFLSLYRTQSEWWYLVLLFAVLSLRATIRSFDSVPSASFEVVVARAEDKAKRKEKRHILQSSSSWSPLTLSHSSGRRDSYKERVWSSYDFPCRASDWSSLSEVRRPRVEIQSAPSRAPLLRDSYSRHQLS